MNRPVRRLGPRSLGPRLRHRAIGLAAAAVERASLPLDRALASRTRVLDRIPAVADRRGGKRAYGEWAWLAGLLGALIDDLVEGVAGPRIVDVGCGPGLVLVAAEPSVLDGGELIGLDVQADEIAFCRRRYPNPPFRFERIEATHPVYAPGGSSGPGTTIGRWPVDDRSADLVTALSVVTHLGRPEAAAFLAETARILRPGAPALISAFLVDRPGDDEPGEPAAGSRQDRARQDRGPEDGAREDGAREDRSRLETSRYHRTAPSTWRFDRALGHGFFRPAWADPPERAVGLTVDALTDLAAEVGLAVERIRPGTWRERRGLYFQDLVVLRRPPTAR